MERCVGGGGHLVTVAGTCHSPVPTPGFVIVRNDQKYLVPYSPVLRTRIERIWIRIRLEKNLLTWTWILPRP